MSGPRGLRPLLGLGSRLQLNQLAPKTAAAGAANSRWHTSSSAVTRKTRAPSPLCMWGNTAWTSAQRRTFASGSDKSPDDKPQENKPHPELPTSAFPSSFRDQFDSTTPIATSAELKQKSDDHVATKAKASTEKTDPLSAASQPDLPSAQSSRESDLARSLSSFMDRAQTALFNASQRINDLTGYSGIDSLKSRIAELEASLAEAQANLHDHRTAYKAAVVDRSNVQREVTTLLARQGSWTAADFERFTTQYKRDHELEAAVSASAAELEAAEREVERLNHELSAGILSRYHEEQIWSDKIRRMSTWGTWGLMGMNFLLFLIFQFGAEPWRRRRLVKGFEEKVQAALEKDRETRHIQAQATAPAPPLASVPDAAPIQAAGAEEQPAGTASATIPEAPEAKRVPPPGEPEVTMGAPHASLPTGESHPSSSAIALSWSWETLSDPERLKAALADLMSERMLALRMRDVSLIALQSAAAGAAVAGTMVLLIARR